MVGVEAVQWQLQAACPPLSCLRLAWLRALPPCPLPLQPLLAQPPCRVSHHLPLQYAELRSRLEQVQSADVLVALMDKMRAEMQQQGIG